MKYIYSIVILLFAFLNLSAQEVTEYFSVGGPIEFCGTEYNLAWSSHPIDDYYMQEYLPKGENFEHYNQMFSVSVIFWDRTAKESVQAKIAELNERKKSDPVINYNVLEKDGEYLLEFIVSDTNGDEINTVEVDLHHYKQMVINGRKATVLSFYSARGYGDDILPFIQSIPDKRGDWYEAMAKLNITPVFP
ncbi:MAG: hypothetical protein K2M61_06585 [Muribaculaceae bacterium]|nr:hypothetical protein [Muribaculaceae bacterium]